MALNDYASTRAFIDGEPIIQLTSLQHVVNSGQQRVDLLNEGLGGFSPGPGDTTISIGFVVPKEGYEHDYKSKCARGDFVTLQVTEGTHFYIGQGKFDTVETNSSVGSATAGTASWVGELKPMEG